MRVLLLEDDLQLQRTTARLIRRTFKAEITIDIVDTAAGAIALLEVNAYAFVLSDFNVREGTGGDVLAWIQANQRHMTERFVFFSGAENLDLWHGKIIEKGIDSTTFVDLLRGYVLVMP